MRSLLGLFAVLALVACDKGKTDKPATTPAPTTASKPSTDTPPAPTPVAAEAGVGKAVAGAASIEIARTRFGSPADSKRTETDAAKIAAFAAAVGDAPMGAGLRRCPDTVVATARAADGTVLAELGFCGQGDDVTEGAEATLPGRARGALKLADATALNALLAP